MKSRPALWLATLGLITSLVLTHASAQAKVILDISQSTTTTLSDTGVVGGTFIVTNMPMQPTGTGNFDPFVRIQQTGQERGYNTSAGFPLDDQGPINYTHALNLSDIPIVTINGTDYREFLLDVNQTGNGNISLNQIQIFQSSADVGLGYTLAEANSTHDAVISFSSSPTLVFQMNNPQNNGTNLNDNREIWINSASGSGSGDMALYVLNSAFANIPGSYITLFSQFGNPSGTYASNAGFEEWAVLKGGPNRQVVPEPATLAMAALGLIPLALAGLKQRRRCATAQKA